MVMRERAAKQRSEVRQEQLVQAALSLLGQDGPRAVTIAEVARRVALVPSGVYRHFRNKDELLDAVLAFMGRRLVANAEAVCRETADAAERLRLLYLRHLRMIRENPGILRLVFSDEVCGGSPERRHTLRRMQEAYLERVAAIVQQGQTEGNLQRNVSPRGAALLFLGLIQPAAILWHLSDGEIDLPAEAERCWSLFHLAIRNQTAEA
ncbi:MAG: helix-turn-helix domain-containing protein [Lentisphaeria bacterium]|nr:helix-turn-helix domain-containing protein [Lentisphaeria bacterium]